MTLEDFFTLTEMKDGLTSLNRVEELVSMMKEDSDSAVKNVSEAARQWSTVASTLATTEHQDSLKHFIRLDGLSFLDRWLQEAEKFSNDVAEKFSNVVADNSMDESISVLLGALKKFPIDNEKLVSSGIKITVKKFLGHKNFMFQEKARDLLDDWDQKEGNVTDKQNILEDGVFQDEGVKRADGILTVNSRYQEQSNLDIVPVKESDNEEKHIVKPIETDFQHSGGSDGSQVERVEDVSISVSNTKDNIHTPSKVDKEDEFQDDAHPRVSSFMSNPSEEEGHSIIDESSARTADRTNSMGVCSSPVQVKGKSSDVPKLKDSDVVEDTCVGEGGKTSEVELCSVVTSTRPETDSSAGPANVQVPVTQSVLSNTDAQSSEFCPRKVQSDGLDGATDTLATDLKVGEVGLETDKHFRSRNEADGCYSENSSVDGCDLRKPENLETSFSKKEDMEAVDHMKGDSELQVEGGKDYAAVTSPKSEVDTKISDINKRSGMDLEYGVDDALEVARQVAKEIEQEVVDYREQFCSSSSDKNPEGGRVHPSSPNSINSKQDQPVMDPQNKLIEQNFTDGALSNDTVTHSENSEHLDKPEDHLHGTGSSQVTEALQKPVETTKISHCDFDLNEVCSEDMDRPRMPNSAPITFVNASKAAAPSLPTSPPRFMGELGWRGSAATSAFRPASGLKTSDGERTLSIDESSQTSKQRRLEIDLNVTEGYGDADGVTNPAPETQIPVSSGLPSGESSVEVCSRRAERLKLDLNRAIDSDEGPSSDARMEGHFTYQHQNSSPSPASSSSSRHPPTLRNFDLNGGPTSFDEFPGLGRSSSFDLNGNGSGSGGFKMDDHVISFMDNKAQVKGKEPVPQIPSFLQNGRTADPPNGAFFPRSDTGGLRLPPPVAYMPPPSSLFGYHNLGTGSSMPFPSGSGICGPGSVPGMVDPRGSSMVPHLMATATDALSSYSQVPFFMSTTGPLIGMNGVGTPRPSLDLNAGFTLDAENRGSGSLRHGFFPGNGILPMDEQMRAASQPPTSSKRKEPDGGWDLYPGNGKRQPPWR